MRDKQCFTSARHANTLGPSTIKSAMTTTKMKFKKNKNMKPCWSALQYVLWAEIHQTPYGSCLQFDRGLIEYENIMEEKTRRFAVPLQYEQAHRVEHESKICAVYEKGEKNFGVLEVCDVVTYVLALN
jgi:hypothetical protein